LNDVQSDEFLKVQKWAELLAKAQMSSEVDSVMQEMRQHYGTDGETRPKSVDMSVKMSPRTQKSYELISSSSSSSLLSLIPDNVLEKF